MDLRDFYYKIILFTSNYIIWHYRFISIIPQHLQSVSIELFQTKMVQVQYTCLPVSQVPLVCRLYLHLPFSLLDSYYFYLHEFLQMDALLLMSQVSQLMIAASYRMFQHSFIYSHVTSLVIATYFVPPISSTLVSLFQTK